MINKMYFAPSLRIEIITIGRTLMLSNIESMSVDKSDSNNDDYWQ